MDIKSLVIGFFWHQLFLLLMALTAIYWLRHANQGQSIVQAVIDTEIAIVKVLDINDCIIKTYIFKA